MPFPPDPELWRRLDAVLDAALDLEGEARRAYLNGACAGDPELRREVEALLAADRAAGEFLEGGVEASAPRLLQEAFDTLEDAGARSWIGRRVGAYRLVGEIGRGGMAVVFLAERDDGQFEQRAAVKLLKQGVGGPGFRDRFLRERRILARLDHPNIARLLDGGMTEEGVPYFVLELVEGRPITEHLREGNLPVPAVLALFAQICGAVDYAHRHLVVHRDLKPGNILVGATGEVKLLDFGIAKVLETGEAEGDGALTSGRFMTPRYAAPEQLRGDPPSTATDVYALGVVLRELLTGVPPGGGEDPSRRRPRRLPGDLEAIIHKAMREDPAERYPGVRDLLEDLDRSSRGLPVRARTSGFPVRAWRFARRHRLAAAAGAVILVSIVTGGIEVARQARSASRERARARLEAERADEFREFTLGLFQAADPGRSTPQDLTLRDLLDRDRERVMRGFAGTPEAQAARLELLGRVYAELGLPDEARDLLAASLRLREEHGGTGSAAAAESHLALGRFLLTSGDGESAEKHLRLAEEIRRREFGAQDRATAEARIYLGACVADRGRVEEGRRWIAEGVAILAREPGALEDALEFGRTKLADSTP